ncbi:MAG: hypothetical protein HQM02_09865 [Magnetococcales bacterium]|nr:hypothetical protein [Magnetococcales bacterium]
MALDEASPRYARDGALDPSRRGGTGGREGSSAPASSRYWDPPADFQSEHDPGYALKDDRDPPPRPRQRGAFPYDGESPFYRDPPLRPLPEPDNPPDHGVPRSAFRDRPPMAYDPPARRERADSPWDTSRVPGGRSSGTLPYADEIPEGRIAGQPLSRPLPGRVRSPDLPGADGEHAPDLPQRFGLSPGDGNGRRDPDRPLPPERRPGPGRPGAHEAGPSFYPNENRMVPLEESPSSGRSYGQPGISWQ